MALLWVTVKRCTAPHLTMVAGERPADGQGVRALIDRFVAIAIGGLIAGGFATEALKSQAIGEKPAERGL